MAEEDAVANDDVFEEPSNPLEKKESEHEKEEEKEEEKPTTAAQSETARTEESTAREAEPLEAEEKPVNSSPKVPSSPIKSEPPKPAQRQFSQLSARSINVNNKKPPTLSRSVSNFSLAHPHLTSVNDFKYLGDQFKVGKPNPAIKASHEVRFQKMWKPKQEKLTQSTIISSARQPLISPRKDVDIVSEFKRTKDPALLAHTYNANDFKHTGDQFKVGKFDPKLESPVEKRFKASFKKRLEKLEPKWDEIKQWKVLTHRDMKEMHNQLAIK